MKLNIHLGPYMFFVLGEKYVRNKLLTNEEIVNFQKMFACMLIKEYSSIDYKKIFHKSIFREQYQAKYITTYHPLKKL